MQIVFAAILIGGVLVLPESPRWLIAHGHIEEGRRVVAALQGNSIHDPAAIAESNMISDGVAAQMSKKVARKAEILKGGKNQHFRRALVGASTQLFQQLGEHLPPGQTGSVADFSFLGGCNAVIYYSSKLFEQNFDLDTELALILGGVLAIVYVSSRHGSDRLPNIDTLSGHLRPLLLLPRRASRP